MKRFLCTTGLLTILACSLPAQAGRAVADIPFDFHVGSSTMPAGKYDIQSHGGVLALRSRATKQSAMQATFLASRFDICPEPRLTFHRYGSQYFLEAVWNPFSNEGRALPKSKQEKQLIKDQNLVQTASVSLHY